MTAPVSPAPVWDVINGLAGYWALHAAVELGVFDCLEAGPTTAAELAAATGIADQADATLLAQLLAAKGLLDTDGARWSLPPAAARFLTSASPASMAALVRHSPGPPAAWPALAATLRAGAPAPELGRDLDALYPELVAATAATQSAVAGGVARELRDRGLWDGTGTVVDLGCGSGAWLRELAGAARAVGVDLSHVLPLARERCPDAELIAGDYLHTALPVAGADVVVLAHVLRAEPADRAAALVARALSLLGDDGVLLVADYFRPDDGGPAAAYAGAGHELTLAMTMRASTGGRGVTAAALAEWCAASAARTVAVLEPVPRQRVLVIKRDPDPTRTGGAR